MIGGPTSSTQLTHQHHARAASCITEQQLGKSLATPDRAGRSPKGTATWSNSVTMNWYMTPHSRVKQGLELAWAVRYCLQRQGEMLTFFLGVLLIKLLQGVC